MLRSGAYRTRTATRNYFRSLDALRAAHSRTYSRQPFIQTVIRPVVNTQESIKTRYIRLPFGISPAQLAVYVRQEVISFRIEEEVTDIEHTITCNVVLEDREYGTYSLFYCSDHAGDQSTLIERPFLITEDFNLEELEYNYTEAEVTTILENVFLPRSGLNVAEIVNWIIQLRALA